MRKLAAAILAASFLSALPAPARAAVTLYAEMTPEQEVPSAIIIGRPRSFGSAIFFLNDLETELRFSAEIFNIDVTGTQTVDTADNLVAAHIHAGSGVSPLTNGPVVFGFFGTPFNDNNPNDVVVTPFATGVGGLFSARWNLGEGNNTTLAAQLFNLKNDRAYINFHTNQFRGGEIRGAISVPEPATWAMLLFGFGLIGTFLRRRRPSLAPA